MTASSEPVDVLQLRMVLRGVNPLIWRRFLVTADSTVADLHYTIQIVMGWEDMHLHRFHIRGCDYGLPREGGLWFRDDARQVKLRKLGLRPGERFVYEYDMGDMWVHELRLERLGRTRRRCPRPVGPRRSGRPGRRPRGHRSQPRRRQGDLGSPAEPAGRQADRALPRRAAAVSVAAVATMMREVLPVAPTTNPETVRQHAYRVAQRMDDDLGDEQFMFVNRTDVDERFAFNRPEQRDCCIGT